MRTFRFPYIKEVPMTTKPRVPYLAIFVFGTIAPVIVVLYSIKTPTSVIAGVGAFILFANLMGQLEGREHKKPSNYTDSDNGSFG